jgi:NAD(P)-dependent dehydrogenase (short-subunit alcohol dehydrogenase family)
MTNLSESNVLVIGGSSGIGAAVVRQAQLLGAKVVVASRTPGAGEPLSGTVSIPLDITDDTAVERTLSGLGPFSHVVVTPGTASPQPVRGGSSAEALRAFDLKFWGAYRVASHVQIVEGGSLTLISGVYAIRPARGHVVGSCVNAAVEALARALALEFAPTRVNCVSPGLVDTPLWDGMRPARRDEFFERARHMLPARHVGTPDDIASLVVACMSNPMLTGAVLVADAGHVLV